MTTTYPVRVWDDICTKCGKPCSVEQEKVEIDNPYRATDTDERWGRAFAWDEGFITGQTSMEKAVFFAVNKFYRRAMDKLCDSECKYSCLECADCYVDDALSEVAKELGVQIVPPRDLEETAKSGNMKPTLPS